jgi:hypothetical protein
MMHFTLPGTSLFSSPKPIPLPAAAAPLPVKATDPSVAARANATRLAAIGRKGIGSTNKQLGLDDEEASTKRKTLVGATV